MLFSYKEVIQVLLDYRAPPMFTATTCVTDIDYIPPPVYYAVGRGYEATVEVLFQREDCPIECKFIFARSYDASSHVL